MANPSLRWDVRADGPIELAKPAAASFAQLDENRNGPIDKGGSEKGILNVERDRDGGVQISALTKPALQLCESDENGSVSRTEFEVGLAAVAAKRR